MVYDGTQGDKALIHESLRHLAWSQVNTHDPIVGDAQLRRAVSSAYYAVFHLLIFESCAFMFPGNDPTRSALRSYASRSFGHSEMKTLCDVLSKHGNSVNATMESLIPRLCARVAPIARVPAAFVSLQKKRARADYETYSPVTIGDAIDAISLMNEAFESLYAAKTENTDDYAALMTVMMIAALKKPQGE